MRGATHLHAGIARLVGVAGLAGLVAGCDTLCDGCLAPHPCAEGEGPLLPPEGWWQEEVDRGGRSCALEVRATEGEGPVPLRPDTTARIVRIDGPAGQTRQWLTARPEGLYLEAVERPDGAIEVYCPRALLVPDGELACQGLHITDLYDRATIEPASPGDAAACLALRLDPTTCEPREADPRCAVTLASAQVDWLVEAVAEGANGRWGPDGALRVRSITRIEGVADDTRYQWWVHGLGPVREDRRRKELRRIEEACLPAEGCTRPAPEPVACP